MGRLPPFVTIPCLYRRNKQSKKKRRKAMEEKKEMTFLEELLDLVDDYQEEQRLKQEKAMEERKKKIDYYLKGKCRTYAHCGQHRVYINLEEVAVKMSCEVTFEDIFNFVHELNLKSEPFYGKNSVEIIWKAGKPEFCEEPPKELPLPEEESADEPSAQSFTEALNKMVDGMTKHESGEDDDETVEDSEYEYAFNKGI